MMTQIPDPHGDQYTPQKAEIATQRKKLERGIIPRDVLMGSTGEMTA